MTGILLINSNHLFNTLSSLGKKAFCHMQVGGSKVLLSINGSKYVSFYVTVFWYLSLFGSFKFPSCGFISDILPERW